LTNVYQGLSEIPLMVSMDAEWGLGMRFKEGVIQYPKQIMLGALKDNDLVYQYGRQMAKECRRLGVHVSFSPVVDVNINANNPVINDRSFGEDKHNVAIKGYLYMKGLQDGNVMACAKHFPGHGDTDVDSHKDLPELNFDRQRLEDVELYPFKVLAQQGLQSMMIAHLQIPRLDSTPGLPSSLSKPIITGLLREDMAFDGLIFTDALEMQGVLKNYPAGELEVRALQAGVDILLLPSDIAKAYKAIKDAVRKGNITKKDLSAKVKRILVAKYRLGLQTKQTVALDHLSEDLNTDEGNSLKYKVIQNALTLVRNNDNLIPLKRIDSLKIATLAIGAKEQTPFQKTVDLYQVSDHFLMPKEANDTIMNEMLGRLKGKDLVLVSLHDMNRNPSKNFGIQFNTTLFLERLMNQNKTALVVFGNPYALKYFDTIPSIVEAYNEDPVTQSLAAQAIFGAFPMTGKLPVTASPKAACNMGIRTENQYRLKYGVPALTGISADSLKKIDAIVLDAMDKGAMPGCEVLVAKDGYVIYQKAFGNNTYLTDSVSLDEVYDLASVTKVAATTLSIMKMVDEKKIDISKPLADYLPELKKTNKDTLRIESILTHRAGLKPWIPFYQSTLTNDKFPYPKIEVYASYPHGPFTVPVTKNLFMDTSYLRQMYKEIYESEVTASKAYKYSDLGFILFAKMIRENTGISLDKYADINFYKPLGMNHTGFNPTRYIGLSKIVPSEEDIYWRNQQIRGYVHDMAAAMLGGVSGHAGLFSNVNDMAKLMQMLLNKGYYGGKQYITEETVNLFTIRPAGSTRRALGFDMQQQDNTQPLSTTPMAGRTVFGHTGFTGTCVWADPENNLVYIFLSNRTYPIQKNTKINTLDVRDRIFSAIYQSLPKNTEIAKVP